MDTFSRMSEKEDLIQDIQEAVMGCSRYWAETIADALIKKGWSRKTSNISDRLYYISQEQKES